MRSYKHFTPEERKSIEVSLKFHQKISDIAKELGRSKSSVSREIKRNLNEKTGKYEPFKATMKYKERRVNCKRKQRILPDTELYRFICEKLELYWSPEIIARKWNEINPDNRISFSTIYNSIRNGLFKDISCQTHLRRRGKKKYGRRNRFNTIHPDHTIHERPNEANERVRCGDWEGDTVRGSAGKGCIVTFVDRKSRKLLCAKSNDMSSKSVFKAILKAFKGIHPKTITLDNGSEFAMFRELEKALDTTVYFADPHSPWQRGSNENTNGILRFFFPKKFDFRTLSNRQLNKVVDLINSRPRLCLGLLSPNDVFCCT